MEKSEYLVMAAVEDRHWWYGGMRRIAAVLLDEAYPARGGLRILDAGCGTGANLRFLRRYGQVAGVDFAPEAVAHSALATPAVARASVVALPLAPAQFDLVTSFEVLYHRGVPDERAALREFARVLRPGGRLLLRLPALELLRGHHDAAVHGLRRYTAGQVQAMLGDTGFAVERISYVNSLLMPLALAQRLAERLSPPAAAESSDLALPPAPLNEAFRWALAAEAAWVARGGRFPAGVSVLCRARLVG